MKGQYGPYIKYKSLNATIPEEKDPSRTNIWKRLLYLLRKDENTIKIKKLKKEKKNENK